MALIVVVQIVHYVFQRAGKTSVLQIHTRFFDSYLSGKFFWGHAQLHFEKFFHIPAACVNILGKMLNADCTPRFKYLAHGKL